MSSMRVVVAVASVFLASLMAAEQASGQATAAPATAADGAPTVMAVWVQKEVNFPYKGLTSYYTCDGIRDKVRADPQVPRRTARVQGYGQVLRQRRRRQPQPGRRRTHAMGVHHGGVAATGHARTAGGAREA